MNNLILSYNLETKPISNDRGDVNFREVWNDTHSIGIELKIRAGAVLARHSAMQAIKVLCLEGSGRFTAGEELDSSADLTRGTVVALEPAIPHEVSADSELLLLVTKFK
jgi:quercetin dioxygenase-like cupin family protein